MRPPRLLGVVERRLLVNYRTDPDITARLLPPPLRPQLVNGWAVSGICLIRLGKLRPRSVPMMLSLRSENAAHRIAVEWDTANGVATGVYIPRRDSNSTTNVLVGGRLFPGQHHRARFDVAETPTDIRVAFASTDGTVTVQACVRTVPAWTGSGLFGSLDEASNFFRRGSVGYSARTEARWRGSSRGGGGDGRCLDGLELGTDAWRVEPVEALHVHSSFFEDTTRFPVGSATLDGALLMRDVPVTWSPLAPMRLTAGQADTPAATP